MNAQLNEDDYFIEVYGSWSGHGQGIMLVLRNDQEHFNKWVKFVEENTNKVEILDPDLFELYLEVGNEDY